MMNRRALPILLATIALGTGSACGKDKSAEKNEPVAVTAPAEVPNSEETPEASGDYIIIEATHAKPKASDPAVIQLTSFRTTAVSFESPDNLDGATATIEIDVASLKSDKKGRDKHLREADYLDTEKFSLSTVQVSNVKRLEPKSYSADLKVSLHGMENTWQVDFIVSETTEKTVTIEMQHTFERRSFGIGAEDASPAQEVLAKVRMTFTSES